MPTTYSAAVVTSAVMRNEHVVSCPVLAAHCPHHKCSWQCSLHTCDVAHCCWRHGGTMQSHVCRVSARGSPAPGFARSLNRVARLQPARYRMGHYDPEVAGATDFDVKKEAEAVATGIVFSPSAEVERVLPALAQATLAGPSGVPRVSIGRMDFASKAEVAINEQINVELNMSYLYLSAAAYFGRDNVGLPGFSAMFKNVRCQWLLPAAASSSATKAKVLSGCQAVPAGSELAEKGDAQHVAEIALLLEKLNFGRLRELRSMADEADDADMAHFVEDYLLDEQSKDVKQAAVLVSQLQRAGKGLGVITIDLALQKKYGVAGADAQPGPGADGATMAITPLL
ncbi:hypothetical protein QJQ45_008077 [Haematococcus lacustris]|nr:hypothetical protein QJQ45_008077 [Haematococcus lacustris]